MTRPCRPAEAAALAFVLLLVACAAPSGAVETQAFVFTTDFSSGTVGSVQFGPPRTPAANQAIVCSDAGLRYHQGLLYVVERIGCDNVRVLNPAAGFGVVRQFGVGNGSNPYDIVLVSPTKAYVSRYGAAELWIVNPESGTKTGEISLAPFADADGIPEMAQMELRNGRLFVAVQRVDRDQFFIPTDSSQVVVVDTATDMLVDVDPAAPGVQGILLPFQNPTTEMVVDPDGKLLVGCTGFYGSMDGGIVRIDPIALTVDGIETTEEELEGDVNDVIVGCERGFTVISDASFNTLCVPYNRSSGVRDGLVFGTAGFFLADAEVNDRNELWISDRTLSDPGMRVFDACTLEPLVTAPIDLVLPPQSLVFDSATPLAAGDGPGPTDGAGAAPSLSLLGIAPNPSAGDATVRVRLSAGAAGAGGARGARGAREIALVLSDVLGRRVRTLRQEVPGPGEYALRWDGKDEAGRRAAPGMYGVRVLAGGSVAFGRMIRLPEAGRP